MKSDTRYEAVSFDSLFGRISRIVKVEIFSVISRTLACEYSRLSFAPATMCETRRETSAIHGQKFHTDDVNLSGIRTGALIGQLSNLHNVCEIQRRVNDGCYCGPNVRRMRQDYEDTPEQ